MNLRSAAVTRTSERAWHLSRQLEPLAARAVPAESLMNLATWSLRLTSGIRSRRANSVLPFRLSSLPFATHIADGTDSGQIAASIDQAAAVYHASGLPLRIQMSPAVSPAWLDDYLQRRGFDRELPGYVMIAQAKALTKKSEAHADVSVRVTPSHTSAWLGMSLAYGSFRGSDLHATDRLLTRIKPMTLYATAYVGSQPAGIGMGVLENGWFGIFSLATVPMYRSRGIGTKIIHSLVRSALPHGASGVYLQVVDDNEGARRLYERLGFDYGYGYHYRSRYGVSPHGLGT